MSVNSRISGITWILIDPACWRDCSVYTLWTVYGRVDHAGCGICDSLRSKTFFEHETLFIYLRVRGWFTHLYVWNGQNWDGPMLGVGLWKVDLHPPYRWHRPSQCLSRGCIGRDLESGMTGVESWQLNVGHGHPNQ